MRRTEGTLEITGLTAGYGETRIIEGLTFTVPAGGRLAPVICDELMQALAQLTVTLILVEQQVDRALDFAQSAVILERGQVVHEGRPPICGTTTPSWSGTSASRSPGRGSAAVSRR